MLLWLWKLHLFCMHAVIANENAAPAVKTAVSVVTAVCTVLAALHDTLSQPNNRVAVCCRQLRMGSYCISRSQPGA